VMGIMAQSNEKYHREGRRQRASLPSSLSPLLFCSFFASKDVWRGDECSDANLSYFLATLTMNKLK